jgi:hypothetical protein
MYPEVELSGNENSERWHTKDLYRNKRITWWWGKWWVDESLDRNHHFPQTNFKEMEPVHYQGHLCPKQWQCPLVCSTVFSTYLKNQNSSFTLYQAVGYQGWEAHMAKSLI